MLSFLTQRLLQIIPTLILVSMLIFGLQQLLPGDPALIMAGEERDPAGAGGDPRAVSARTTRSPIQYFDWMKGVLSRRSGASMRLSEPWRRLVGEKLPVTLQLAVMALIVALGIGIPGRHRLGGEEGHGLGLRAPMSSPSGASARPTSGWAS